MEQLQTFAVLKSALQCLLMKGLLLAYFSTEYVWSDGARKIGKISAPQYIDYVMSWIQTQLDDQALFPTKASTFSSD